MEPLPRYGYVATIRDIDIPCGMMLLPTGMIGKTISLYPAHGVYLVEFVARGEVRQSRSDMPLMTDDAARLTAAGRTANDDFGEDLSHLTPEQMR